MTQADWGAVKALFERALDQPAPARAAWLAAARALILGVGTAISVGREAARPASTNGEIGRAHV